MRISKSFRFEAAHRLQRHDGHCRNLHGHSYLVEVFVNGSNDLVDEGPETGMLMDFGRLNDWWESPAGGSWFDHKTILEEADPLEVILAGVDEGVALVILPFAPTAENLAKYLQDQLQGWLLHHARSEMQASCSVRVWETAKSWAEA